MKAGRSAGRGTCSFSIAGVLKGILNQFNQWLVFPLGRNLRPCQTSGILETTTPVGLKLVVIHSEGKEARKLKGFAEFRGSVDVGDRILQGFTFAERYDSLRLLIYMAPIQILKVFEIWKHVFTKKTIQSQNAKRFVVRNASQGPALTGWLLLSRRSGC